MNERLAAQAIAIDVSRSSGIPIFWSLSGWQAGRIGAADIDPAQGQQSLGLFVDKTACSDAFGLVVGLAPSPTAVVSTAEYWAKVKPPFMA